VDKKE
jgi:hypothetical protein